MCSFIIYPFIRLCAHSFSDSFIDSSCPLPPSPGGGAERGRDIRADEQSEEGGHLLLLPQPRPVEHLGRPLQDRRGGEGGRLHAARGGGVTSINTARGANSLLEGNTGTRGWPLDMGCAR